MRLPIRSEEHTSELQSHDNLVCRLLLEKKKKQAVHRVLQPPSRHYPRATPHSFPERRIIQTRLASSSLQALSFHSNSSGFFFFNEGPPPNPHPFPPPTLLRT